MHLIVKQRFDAAERRRRYSRRIRLGAHVFAVLASTSTGGFLGKREIVIRVIDEQRVGVNLAGTRRGYKTVPSAAASTRAPVHIIASGIVVYVVVRDV